jgi:hypothetical protein
MKAIGRLAGCVVMAGICLLSIRAQEPSRGAEGGTATEELRKLMSTALTAARQNDEGKLNQIAHEMMIPNYEVWFKTTFGEERGTRMAAAYGRNLDQKEKSLPWVLGLMAKKEGALLVEDVREPLTSGENWCAKALVDTAKKDTAFYLVTLEQAQSDGTKRYSSAGHFTLVEGAYRRLDCFDLGLSAGPGHRIVGPSESAGMYRRQESSTACSRCIRKMRGSAAFRERCDCT